MSRKGDSINNPVTGERGVVRVGSEETGGKEVITDLYVQPGGAVVGEHIHSVIEERFTVVSGRVGFRVAGREAIAQPGEQLIVPPGVAHDWWNAGEEEAHVIVEIRPAERFEAMISNLFGLAQDGKTDAKGMPNLLQLAVFAAEFEDVVVFTRPPRWVQKVLFGMLAPLARLLGYKGNDPKYLERAAQQRTTARVSPA